MNVYFNLFLKKKMLQTYAEAWKNLNAYCQNLLRAGKEHPYHIELEKNKLVA